MPFRILDNVAHADFAIEVTAENVKELFQETATAVQSLQFDLSRIKPLTKKEVRLENYTDLKELLYSFLCEIIFYKDADALALGSFEVEVEEVDGKFSLRAELAGEKIDPNKHILHADIKAITRHLLDLQRRKDKWIATVVVDV